MTVANPVSPGGRQHIVLENISWETYEQILHDLEERAIRVTYDRGNLEMMAPLPYHEQWKRRYGRLIDSMCEERDLDVEALGSTTFRRADLEKGLEPDDCYYVHNPNAVRGRRELDLRVDPPPDLAIEIDITRASIPKQPIYAALGIPEIWRFDGTRLTVLRLRDGKYSTVEKSDVFPFLPMETFQKFVIRLESERHTPVLREFRTWVKTL